MSEIKKYSLIDFFFDKPIFSDAILVTLFITVDAIASPIVKSTNYNFNILTRTDALTYLAYIVSSDVTFAGFILAALTILITVKSSLTARGYADADNAMAYFLSTKNYPKVVRVFIQSIVQLFVIFVFLFSTWLVSKNLSDSLLYKILCLCTLVIFLAIFRVLFVLFGILNLENLKRT